MGYNQSSYHCKQARVTTKPLETDLSVKKHALRGLGRNPSA